MKTYASLDEFSQREVRDALATDETLTSDKLDRVMLAVTLRLRAAGHIVWVDGWDDVRGAYWLPAQGFAWATDPDDDDGAAFWAVAADVLDVIERCPAWCTAEHWEPEQDDVHSVTVERTASHMVQVYATPDEGVRVHVDAPEGLALDEAATLATALAYVASMVDGGVSVS